MEVFSYAIDSFRRCKWLNAKKIQIQARQWSLLYAQVICNLTIVSHLEALDDVAWHHLHNQCHHIRTQGVNLPNHDSQITKTNHLPKLSVTCQLHEPVVLITRFDLELELNYESWLCYGLGPSMSTTMIFRATRLDDKFQVRQILAWVKPNLSFARINKWSEPCQADIKLIEFLTRSFSIYMWH